MKGKIKVTHEQQITLTFHKREWTDAFTLAGKYIGKHNFKAKKIASPTPDRPGHIILEKEERASFEPNAEPKTANLYPNK